MPHIEIADKGNTRLRRTVTRTFQALVALLLTAVVKALINVH